MHPNPPIFSPNRIEERRERLRRPCRRALRAIREKNPRLRLAIAEDNDGVAAWDDTWNKWIPVCEYLNSDTWHWVDGHVIEIDGKPPARTWIEIGRGAKGKEGPRGETGSV